jgi:hypothetical protein
MSGQKQKEHTELLSAFLALPLVLRRAFVVRLLHTVAFVVYGGQRDPHGTEQSTMMMMMRPIMRLRAVVATTRRVARTEEFALFLTFPLVFRGTFVFDTIAFMIYESQKPKTQLGRL